MDLITDLGKGQMILDKIHGTERLFGYISCESTEKFGSIIK